MIRWLAHRFFFGSENGSDIIKAGQSDWVALFKLRLKDISVNNIIVPQLF